MKELILMRHAKSSWDFENLNDHERPLNKRGRSDAKKMGAHLVNQHLQPQIILSSNAQRTQETTQLLCEQFVRQPLVLFLPSLYLASLGAIQAALEFIHPETERIMIIGHNPGWSEVNHWLSGNPVDFKTATTTVMTHDAQTWQEAIQTPASWTQTHVLHSKEI